ncbi:hypothetical protein KUCAC02_022003, partial [Chaenocephalus aceratus]
HEHTSLSRYQSQTSIETPSVWTEDSHHLFSVPCNPGSSVGCEETRRIAGTGSGFSEVPKEVWRQIGVLC